MDRPRYARQLFFFLLAVLVPSTALVIFGAGFLVQERELAGNRAVDARASFARDIGRQLEDRLDQLTEEASVLRLAGVDSLRTPVGHEVLWLGTLNGTQFRPAWSDLAVSAPVAWGDQQSAFSRAERVEVRDRNPAAAADVYVHLARHARDLRQASQAGLRAARALVAAGMRGRAMVHARQVLHVDSSVQDEFGVPFAYYAADMLLSAATDSVRSMVAGRLTRDLDDPRWFAPERTYMLRDLLLASVPDTSLAAEAGVQRAEQVRLVVVLQEDLAGLVRSGATERWFRYGEWLISTGPGVSDGGRDFFAVNPAALVELADQPSVIHGIQLEGDRSAEALPLTPYFRETYVVLGPIEIASESIPRGLFVLVLVLFIGLTLFGGYLLWRDVQRESRLAQLRAQFVSSVSHEFRTPLTSIRMFAEVMMTGKDTPPEHQRYLGVISNESDRLTRMLNNVLSASRIEQGTSTYHPAVGDLRDPVCAAVEALRYTFDQQGVDLNVTLPAEPVLALVDADAIEQCVLNLLSNALKYGEGSTISVVVQTGPSGETDLLVSDLGPGIEESELGRIFDRFYRTASAENGRTAGVGLGLPLVKHITESHGGRVTVESTLGRGSTFGIHLPTTQ